MAGSLYANVQIAGVTSWPLLQPPNQRSNRVVISKVFRDTKFDKLSKKDY
jgi:hypothetical protein